MKVAVIYQNFAGQTGYDLCVRDSDATVQDYLDALNEFILDQGLTRSRSNTTECEGCVHCCSERIPLTSPDIIRLWQSNAESGSTIAEIINHFGEITDLGLGYDVTLKRFPDGRCKFLNEQSGRCTIYQYRPLVCQTFICCPSSKRAQELRSAIVNQGEDELIRLWGMDHLLEKQSDQAAGYHSQDYGLTSENMFTGKTNYGEVLLREVSHPKLWEQLTLK